VPDGGRLEARWTGLRTGRAAPAATAYWCGPAHRLVVMAMHGDTAIGLTVYPAGDTIGGAAPVLDSAAADSVRPRARAALRWLDSVSIPAFEGSAGTVRLARRGGTVTGSFDVTMRSVNATRAGPGVASGSVHVTGRAVAVPVESGGCNF
jgi:hypothetical protein